VQMVSQALLVRVLESSMCADLSAEGIINLIEIFLESVLDSLIFREVLLALSGSIGSLERKVTSLCLDRWVTHSYIFIHEFSFPYFVYLLISFACPSLICSSLQINKISMIESVPD
jgi:hypothetical protein